MKLKFLEMIVLSGVLLCLPVVSQGADVAKIGVVDFQLIIEKSISGKESKDKINTQGKQMESDLKKKGAELEELKSRLEREALVMSADQREEKEREFRIKVNDFKALQHKYEKDLQQIQKRVLSRIKKDVFDIVKELGKQEGYLMIIEKVGVLYYPQALDLTDRVIQIYNEKYKKPDSK